MKAMLFELRQAAFATLALAVVCCGLYPLLVFGIGQVLFLAKARGLALEQVRDLIQQYTDSASLGLLGDPGVNVLRLNLALDATVTGDRRAAMVGSR